MDVREAHEDEVPAVLSILDGGLLSVTPAQVRAGETLVATDGDGLLGALVLDGERVVGLAVRPRNRDRGIGTALVEAAAARRDRLVAAFDADVRPFYASLGFAIEPAADPGRLRGVRDR